jgi:hypothetical protein
MVVAAVVVVVVVVVTVARLRRVVVVGRTSILIECAVLCDFPTWDSNQNKSNRTNSECDFYIDFSHFPCHTHSDRF